MNDYKLIYRYSTRLLIREWRRFVLPLLSLTITGVILMLMLLLTDGSALLIHERARELQGGDVVIESNSPADADAIIRKAELVPEGRSAQIDFTATIASTNRTAPVALRIVDEFYPLYGTLTLQSQNYTGLTDSEILLDTNAADRLSVGVGDTITLNTISYTITGIIGSEPTSLFGGFRFLPRAIMSDAGFARAELKSEFLRIEYSYAYRLQSLSTEARAVLEAFKDDASGIDIDIAGTSRTGIGRRLTLVTEFFAVGVLITAILGAVNIYASTVFLITTLRKSFAVLLALGMRTRTLTGILASTLTYIVLLGTTFGVILGGALFVWIQQTLNTHYHVLIPTPPYALSVLITLFLIFTTTVGAFIPAVRSLFGVSPKQVLIGGESGKTGRPSWQTLVFITTGAFVPLTLLAIILLKSITEGILTMLAVTLVYIGIAGMFTVALNLLYRHRGRFSFLSWSIIAQKKADGLFGIVSFTSLFIALTAISTLVLVHVSLEKYLAEDLSQSVPSTYVIDVQPSQKVALMNQFPTLTLFPNIPARIIDIDGRRIQELLAEDSPTIDRELGREYNLTFRNELIESETVVQGVWGNGKPGEISVDAEFAERAGIALGSNITFLIQGFEVTGTVTSMRDTESRSGLPFFYFILSPHDIEKFPSIYFGYGFLDADTGKSLGTFLAQTMPNVSYIETQGLGPLLKTIVTTLVTLVFVITVPPLLIATLLIATLVVSSYASRRREGGRMRALGAPLAFVQKQYLLETVLLTLTASGMAYFTSIVATIVITKYQLSISSVALFDFELVLGLMLIVLLIGMIGLYLFKTDRMPLRELLAYEENH